MSSPKRLLACRFLVFALVFTSIQIVHGQNSTKTKSDLNLEKWKEGYLDIHHISTGNGDTCFMILPDGTTLLFDAGIMDKKTFEKKYVPLKATATIPDSSRTAAQWIAKYIKHVAPKGLKTIIDYALISHFHSDHYGSLVELGKLIPIKKIIDRDYPEYNFPLNLREYLQKDKIFQNYLSYIDKSHIPAEKLIAGRNDQIKLLNDSKNFPNFSITNVKSGSTIWTGSKNETIDYFTADQMIDFYNGKYNENPLSLAIKISYGTFDYYTGGDNTGLQGFGLPKWFDVETPMAKAVGKVEVIALNHHGNRDATNDFFIKSLDPKVVVQQAWCSDQPGQEVYQRLIYKDSSLEDRDIFATYIHSETKVTYGPWFRDNYKSMEGHIVVRVLQGGSTYYVYVLNEKDMSVKQQYGPYSSKM